MEDRIGIYLRKSLHEIIFVEVPSILKGVDLPLSEEDLRAIKDGKGIQNLKLTSNMACVIGSDLNFRYNEEYKKYIKSTWGDKMGEGLCRLGKSYADSGDFINACIYFRAALYLEPDMLDAMFSYAMLTRKMYEDSKEDVYIGKFKAESMSYLEETTLKHPDFPDAHFYLGYAYLNLGLYSKAEIAWKQFVELASNILEDMKDGLPKKELQEKLFEVKGRLSEITEPVKIEAGYNHVLAGRFEEGLKILEGYRNSKYDRWWPLYYYLGIAYECTARFDEALESFKKVLSLNASHEETMKELANIYMLKGDNENAEKYNKKLDLIRKELKN